MSRLSLHAKLILRKFLCALGYHVSRTTDAASLEQFFAAARPYTTNHTLVRVGAAGDGGYLIPDDLDGVTACFSPGVASVAAFEEAMTQRGIHCYLADYSVIAPPVRSAFFDFEKKFLGTRNDEVYMTLQNWVTRKSPVGADSILQMDIEGAEYAVLLDSDPQLLRRFRIIIVEFHGLEALFDISAFELINLTFVKLLRDFELVHIHPNNVCPVIGCQGFYVPTAIECTFLRKDRVSRKVPTTTFPHALDNRNVEHLGDIALPRCWYE